MSNHCLFKPFFRIGLLITGLLAVSSQLLTGQIVTAVFNPQPAIAQ